MAAAVDHAFSCIEFGACESGMVGPASKLLHQLRALTDRAFRKNSAAARRRIYSRTDCAARRAKS